MRPPLDELTQSPVASRGVLGIFISSLQKEFAAERRALKDYIHGDPLLRRFFEVFLFEDLPAVCRRHFASDKSPWRS